MQTTSLTVIICCYNAANTIEDTLNTLLEQSYSDFSILVIDDGSSDNSIAVVQRIASRDSRIRLLSNEINRGVAYTRMRGLLTADTDLVTYFDADDLADKCLLERLLNKLSESEKLIAVSCYSRYFSDAGDLGTQRVGPTSEEEFFDLYHRNKLLFLLPVTVFYRERALAVGGYRLNLIDNDKCIRYEDFSEDVDLWCRMADLGVDGYYMLAIPEPLFRYRKPAGSLSSRNVGLMQLKMRWIKDCLLQRRSGRTERSLAEFMRSRTLIQRFNDYREDLAAAFYKKAGFAYSNKKYLSLLFNIALAGLLSPKLIRQKIKTQTKSISG